MLRYWVIAPFRSTKPDLFDKVWRFDLANDMISIGWSELGDVSKISREKLSDIVASKIPNLPSQTKTLIANMLWAFYHEIRPDDFVIARRGRKTLAAVGEVRKPGVYAPRKSPLLTCSPENAHCNFLEITWQQQPRDKVFPGIVFPMHTLSELTEDQFRNLSENSDAQSELDEGVEDRNAFVLEKYLEDFIVSNFTTIFKGKMEIYENAEGADGQQYSTDIGAIDILAVEPDSNSFVVIELKKGRPSDQVVGQIPRYMGWIKKNLCQDSQAVKGLVICHDSDPKLSYALEMTDNIEVRYYSVSFKLNEAH